MGDEAVSVQHTRGPWAVSKNSTGRRVTSQTGVVICNAVLRNQGGPKHKAYTKCVEEAEANARLIAAAPDLLEIAERALRFAEMGTDSPALVTFRADARTALCKAKGTQP